jgi:DNA-binding transcriptional LysR family regulator
MAVQLKSLKVFCDVVRLRSFSRAADQNEISQSGASQLVQQIEEGLGVKLIDRSKRPFVLTSEGEVYYEGCRGVVERYFAVEDRVRTLHQEVAGHVRVASIYSVGLHHMNRHLHDFLSQHPKANVRLEYLHPHRVYQSVEDDLSDLGLVSYPKSSRTVTALAWREEPMVLVTSPGHPLARRVRIGLKELNGEKMVGFDADLTIRREIDRVLDLHGAEVRVVMEFDNIETIKRAIEIDAGVGLLPEPTVVREVQSGTLASVPLDTDALVRPLGIIHRRGKELSSTARRFIELLQREANHAQTAEAKRAASVKGQPAASANGQARHLTHANAERSEAESASHGATGGGEAEANGRPTAASSETHDGNSSHLSTMRRKAPSGGGRTARRERVLEKRR